MVMLATMLARMEIKTLILLVTNSITMLALIILMLNLNRWSWRFLKESSTLKLDWSGIIGNMKENFLVISKSCSILVVDDFFPRSDDGLGKIIMNPLFWNPWKWIYCMLMHHWKVFFTKIKRKLLNCRFMNRFNFIWNWFWSCIIVLFLHWLLIKSIIIIIIERIVLNKN